MKQKHAPGKCETASCCGCVATCLGASVSVGSPATNYDVSIPGIRPLSRSGNLTWTSVPFSNCCAFGNESFTDTLLDDNINHELRADDYASFNLTCSKCNAVPPPPPGPDISACDSHTMKADWIYYRLQTQYKKVIVEYRLTNDTWENSDPDRRGASFNGNRCGLEILLAVELDVREAARNYFVTALSQDPIPMCNGDSSGALTGDFSDRDKTPPDITSSPLQRWIMLRRIFLPDIFVVAPGSYSFPNATDRTALLCSSTSATLAPSQITTAYASVHPVYYNNKTLTYLPECHDDYLSSSNYTKSICYLIGGLQCGTVFVDPGSDLGWVALPYPSRNYSVGHHPGSTITSFTRSATGNPRNTKTFWLRQDGTWTLTLS